MRRLPASGDVAANCPARTDAPCWWLCRSVDRGASPGRNVRSRFPVSCGRERRRRACRLCHFRGLVEDSGSIELKRIVVVPPGQGLGRRILHEVLRIAFDELHGHRLFLDIFEDNTRARHLYESLGFRHEGTLREADRRDDSWCTLCLISMLESEYTHRKQRDGETEEK